MSTDMSISINARSRQGVSVEQAVAAMAPLLKETGHPREAVLGAFLACADAEAPHSAQIVNRLSSTAAPPWANPLYIWTTRKGGIGFAFSGPMSDKIYDLAQQVATALGPLTACPGEITIKDEETADPDNTAVIVFGASPEAIAVYRFEKARDQALDLLVEFIGPKGCERLATSMNDLNFVYRHTQGISGDRKPQNPQKSPSPGPGPA